MCNEKILEYFKRYKSVGYLRALIDLKYLEAKGINVRNEIECLKEKNLVKLVKVTDDSYGYVINYVEEVAQPKPQLQPTRNANQSTKSTKKKKIDLTYFLYGEN